MHSHVACNIGSACSPFHLTGSTLQKKIVSLGIWAGCAVA